jgi:hypothetical protein
MESYIQDLVRSSPCTHGKGTLCIFLHSGWVLLLHTGDILFSQDTESVYVFM